MVKITISGDINKWIFNKTNLVSTIQLHKKSLLQLHMVTK
jgi:hypothetical protein